jgi:hypothetical protein
MTFQSSTRLDLASVHGGTNARENSAVDAKNDIPEHTKSQFIIKSV